MTKSKKAKSGPWSEEEIKLLKRLFPSGKEKDIVIGIFENKNIRKYLKENA